MIAQAEAQLLPISGVSGTRDADIETSIQLSRLRDRLAAERERLVLALSRDADGPLSLLPVLATVQTAIVALDAVERELAGP